MKPLAGGKAITDLTDFSSLIQLGPQSLHILADSGLMCAAATSRRVTKLWVFDAPLS